MNAVRLSYTYINTLHADYSLHTYIHTYSIYTVGTDCVRLDCLPGKLDGSLQLLILGGQPDISAIRFYQLVQLHQISWKKLVLEADICWLLYCYSLFLRTYIHTYMKIL